MSASAASGSDSAPPVAQPAAEPASEQQLPASTETQPPAEAPRAEPPSIAAAPEPAAAPVGVPVDETAEEPAEEAPAAQEPSGYGCDAALAYLRANAHPAFALVCPGYAFGGQAVTCLNHAPECPGSAVIIINVPCEIAYKNEAANSWTIYNGTGSQIDPYGARC